MHERIICHMGTQVRDLEPDPRLTLAQLLFLSGAWSGRPLCAGLGRCGLCRVHFLSAPPSPTAAEERQMTPEELAHGVRLACQHMAGQGYEIELPEAPPFRRPRVARTRQTGAPRSLAVDIGATSLHWSLLERPAGGWRRLTAGGEPNPQLGAGGDVVSRLSFATKPEGKALLRRLVLDRITDLASEAGGLEGLAVAGNPAMIHLLLDLDVSGLSRAPYRLAFQGGEERPLASALPTAYIPPLLAPFVGADVSAGLAALFFRNPLPAPAFPFILADLGTNGEFVLALSENEFLIASAPMGPALEGMGLSFGAVADRGAITAFETTPLGLEPRFFSGPEGSGSREADSRASISCRWPARMSGTGYVSLLARLVRLGLLDERGGFQPAATPLAAKLARGLRPWGGETALDLPAGMRLPASDVEEVLKVKAAFNAALSALLQEAGLGFEAVRAVYLAGALGEHVRPLDLETLGFLPPGASSRVEAVGNTSLAGAELCLTDARVRPWLADLSGKARLIDLAGRAGFMHDYLRRMIFRHVA